MKEKIRLLIFAIIVGIIAYFISSQSFVSTLIAKIEPEDLVSQQILYKDLVSQDKPYTLNIYSNISEQDFLYSDENQLIKTVANYTPELIATVVRPNKSYEVQELMTDFKLKNNNFAILLDRNGYVLSIYSYPYDTKLILSNLTNLSNLVKGK